MSRYLRKTLTSGPDRIEVGNPGGACAGRVTIRLFGSRKARLPCYYHLLPSGAGMQYRQLQRYGFLPIMLISYMLPGVVQFFLWPAFQLRHLALVMIGPVALPNGLPLP